jgi:hypothetical protein
VLELPQAFIGHHSHDRLRIRIASRRGDNAYFAKVLKNLSGLQKFKHITATPLTGSVLFMAEGLNPEKIAAHARDQQLFDLTTAEPSSLPLMHRMAQPLERLDRSLRTITAGKIDLPSGIFFALLGTGIYQLARGRFSTPPWYTAFWYAFGLFSMYAIKKTAEGVKAPPSG